MNVERIVKTTLTNGITIWDRIHTSTSNEHAAEIAAGFIAHERGFGIGAITGVTVAGVEMDVEALKGRVLTR